MEDPTRDERRKRFATAVVGRELLGHVAQILRDAQIDVMPLKGVLLHALVYDEPADRSIVDVDIAVRSVDHARSVRALKAAGFRATSDEATSYETVLTCERWSIPVDLHRRFSTTRRHRLTPDVMFARGFEDEALYGFRVILPDYYDLYCHLLAHSTLDYVISGRWHHPEDLPLLVRKANLDPVQCARRLEEHGLPRFARVAFGASSAKAACPFEGDLLAALAPDPVGDVLSRLAVIVAGRGRPESFLRRLAALLLNPTLAATGLALADAAIVRLSRRRNPA